MRELAVLEPIHTTKRLSLRRGTKEVGAIRDTICAIQCWIGEHSIMGEGLRDLGKVKMVQLQPSGLIIQSGNGELYDPARRLEVDHLLITSRGVETTTVAGRRLLDIHHMDHPDKAYGSRDLVSIGFTSHYNAMRERFGEHMTDGVAGENIVVEYDHEVWMDDMGQQVAIESAQTGDRAMFDVVEFAAPCTEFSSFAARPAGGALPADQLKRTLQFLNDGRRGFLIVLSQGQQDARVEPGDKVFAIFASL
jgi:hypothetical protein